MTGELAARRTAAGAVLADFRRWAAGELVPGDWQDWALRLAAELDNLLAQLATEAGNIVPAVLAGNYDLTADELRTVLDALDVAAACKRDRAASCPDCDAHPANLCTTCEWRLRLADSDDTLARRLGGAQ